MTYQVLPLVEMEGFQVYETDAKTLNYSGEFEVGVRREVKWTLNIAITGREECRGTFQVVTEGKDGSISVYPSADLDDEEPTNGSCTFSQEIASPEFALFGDGQAVRLIWNENGVYTQLISTIQDGSLVFEEECEFRIQEHGDSFTCSVSAPEGYS